MKRTENGVNARINHIHFHGDCLVFEFTKSNGDQKTGKKLGPWHVYANPSKMWLCPVISLSRYLFCYPDVLNVNVQMFEGRSQYKRCDTRLMKLVKYLDTQLKRLDFEVGDLGSYYCHKGVATMVAAGCTVYIPIFALCFWVGWVLERGER